MNNMKKILNIILAIVISLGSFSLTSCNDYLDVDAPSAYTNDFVFSQKSEIERALNGVYAQALVNNLYGNNYQRTFILNSDVDMMISSSNAHYHNSYTRFDCDDQGGEVYSFWTAAYGLIEYANKFITNAEASKLYDPTDKELMQWIGEAKCLRAMAYHDLVVMYGDIPFTSEPAAMKGTDFVIPVADRQEIQDFLIKDLSEIAPYMSTAASVTVEHCSKEFAQAMIARIALAAGGYSLHPDKNDAKSYGSMTRPDNYLDYYKIAMAYTDSVISAKGHSLTNKFQDVFVKECNYEVVNNDDPIFEIPFAKESTGNTGYIQGPTYSSNEGETVGVWGECSGNGRLNAFYRFLFRDNDVRKEEVNGLWYYSYYTNSDGALADSIYIRNDYTVHNNKWSKLWTKESNALGKDKSGSTGINFPYMRYADVLLMYAEAANEVNGKPTEKALDCLSQVHKRAFGSKDDAYLSALAGASKEDFLKAVLDERKWEFAGENMRWRDLVRNNMYAEEIMYCFLRYYSAGVQNTGSMSGFEDAINEHDGKEYIDNLPERIYYHAYKIEEANVMALKLATNYPTLYGYEIDPNSVLPADPQQGVKQKYPNQTMKSLRIYNAYKPAQAPVKSAITNCGFSAAAWNNADFYQWGDANSGQPKDQCKYSFYGYIRADDGGNIWIIRDGKMESFSVIPSSIDKLPPVRYILPYPNLAIQRSNGAYKNYYGY